MKFTTLFIDLDDTLYPADSGLWPIIRERIGLYMHERMGLSWEEIPPLRMHFYKTYGTSLRGLIIHYQIDPHDYLDYVHDVPLEKFIQPQPELRDLLLSLPQRKIIFTNADRNHARRVMARLGVADCFEQIIDILDISPYCKPMKEAFEMALKTAGQPDPAQCIFLDDSIDNLSQARQLGFYTIRVGKEEPSDHYHFAIGNLYQFPQKLNEISLGGGNEH